MGVALESSTGGVCDCWRKGCCGGRESEGGSVREGV